MARVSARKNSTREMLLRSKVSTVPSEDDWHREGLCWDGQSAYENFNCKDADTVVAQLRNTYSAEDFYWMPDFVFPYYLRAYAKFLLSDESRRCSDLASCFFGTIEHRLESAPDIVSILWTEIIKVLERLSAEQEFYNASEEIYGSFAAKAASLVEAAKAKLGKLPK